MLAVYVRRSREADALRAGLPSGEHWSAHSNWTAFQHALATASCGIVSVEWLSDGEHLRRLTDLRHDLPDTPVVLVTRKDADNARLLKGLILEEVVWTHEASGGLASAVARAETHSTLREVCTKLGTQGRLSPRMRKIVLYLCERGHDVRSVASLARALHCDRRTLWYAWHQAMPGGPRLEDFIHWLLLLNASALRASLKNWSAVAGELRVDKRTLSRHTDRLLGISLRELAALDRRDLMRAFHTAVVTPLLSVSVLDISS